VFLAGEVKVQKRWLSRQEVTRQDKFKGVQGGMWDLTSDFDESTDIEGWGKNSRKVVRELVQGVRGNLG